MIVSIAVSINLNGAPISRSANENMRKERAMLAQADTTTKAQVLFANRNRKSGKPDCSDAEVGLD